MTNTRQFRILFLLQRAEGWSNIRSVWRMMNADPRFLPEVCVLPYDVRKPGEIDDRRAQVIALLTAESVAFVVWNEGESLDLSRFDVAVFTTPYDTERPSQLHFDVVARQVPVTAYIPYGFVVGGGRKNQRLQYAQPTQMHSTLVFARSWREREMYRRHCPTGDTHVRVTGLPRLDDLATMPAGGIDQTLLDAIDGRFAVLWNSHFTVGGHHAGSLDYSTFDRMASGLFEFAAGSRDVALIWRPHPQLLPTLVDSGMLRAGDLTALEQELTEAGIILDRRTDHRHAFAASDALITDAGSFLIEYLITGKPMAYLRNPDGPGLTEEAEQLAGQIDVAIDPTGAVSFVELARGRRNRDSRHRERMREEFLPMQDGRASARILDCIASATATTIAGSRCDVNDMTSYPTLSTLTKNLSAAFDARNVATPPWSRNLRRAYRGVVEELIEVVKRRPALLRIMRNWRRP